MQKHYLLSFIIAFFALTNGFSQQAFLSQGVIDALIDADANERIPIMLELEDVVDIKALNSSFKSDKVPVNKRAQIVMEKLKTKANSTQPAVISFIESSGMQYDNLRKYWIANVITLNASPELISNLANLESVGRIELEIMAELDEPTKSATSSEKSVGGTEPGLVAIGSPEMWAMGYTGQSRIALTMDTGAWPDHPAFENRYLANRTPLEGSWLGFNSPLPTDGESNHGTHVSGTILGLDTATADTIGNAMNAYLLVTNPISNSAGSTFQGFQWAMNPDGDETTSSDIPDVINNSWGSGTHNGNNCPGITISVMEAVEAAGIANVFSAGNEGPDPITLTNPKNINVGLVNTFTVAAVNGSVSTLPIAEFSSRGPSICGGTGSLLIKPEVSAPGVSVRSSVANGQYDTFSGTSMAAPHVSGAVLLLKEAFPYLSGEDILLALYYTAIDLGVAGEDNVYGMGIINVKAAYDYLSETNEPVPPAARTTDIELVYILSPSDPNGCSLPGSESVVTPIVVVRNNGINTITGIDIHYTLNGANEMTFTDSEMIFTPGSDTEITLPAIASNNNGMQELHIWITPLDDEYDKLNNNNVFRWTPLPQLNVSNGFTENFNFGINPNIWTIENPDSDITWSTLDALQANGENGNVGWMDFRNYTQIASQKDDLITPVLYDPSLDEDFANVNLSFDLFYRKKTNNDYTKDTLAIFLNQFCGSEDELYSEVYREGGDSLYTTTEGPSAALPQEASEWRHVELSIPLTNGEAPYFYFTFQGINRRGNTLLIDNININLDQNVGIIERNSPEIKLYPNPTSSTFSLVSEEMKDATTMDILDVFGRKVAEYNIDSSTQFDVSSLANGVYLVRVHWNNGLASVLPLVIQ